MLGVEANVTRSMPDLDRGVIGSIDIPRDIGSRGGPQPVTVAFVPFQPAICLLKDPSRWVPMTPMIEDRQVVEVSEACELSYHVRIVVERRIVRISTIIGGSISGHVSPSRRRLQRRPRGNGRAAYGDEGQEVVMHCCNLAPTCGAATVPMTDKRGKSDK